MLEGLDVSHHNGPVNAAKIRTAGKDFLFHKATEGLTFLDSFFKDNLLRARDAGLLCGGYHFFRPDSPAEYQANNFSARMKTLDFPGLPILDLEWVNPGSQELWAQVQGGPQACLQMALTWLETVKKNLNVNPVVYSTHAFLNQFFPPESPLGSYPLWLARYAPDPGQVPPTWSKWTFWQYTESGTCLGVSGACDLSKFDGNSADLTDLLAPVA